RDHKDAILSQPSPIAKNDLLDVADPETVHIHEAGRNALSKLSHLAGQFDGLAVLAYEDALGGYPDVASEVGVVLELPVLAVDRNEVARPDELEHLAQLFAMGVARNVNVVGVCVEDAGTVAVEIVDRLMDQPLVARSRTRGDGHPVRK